MKSRFLKEITDHPHYKVGDKIETWFSDSEDGKSTILAVYPYNGRYPFDFSCILRVTAPRTRKGWMEIAAE